MDKAKRGLLVVVTGLVALYGGMMLSWMGPETPSDPTQGPIVPIPGATHIVDA